MLYAILMWEVNLELVESWLDDLDQNSYEHVVAALELLWSCSVTEAHSLDVRWSIP